MTKYVGRLLNFTPKMMKDVESGGEKSVLDIKFRVEGFNDADVGALGAIFNSDLNKSRQLTITVGL